jgi:protein-S-isoprenylcysteine O-methyltransferase Ste14
MPDRRSLLSRLLHFGFVGQLALALLLFFPAGTLKFWQGWAFIIVNLAASLCFCIYFYQRDPQLLERRLLTREKIGAQKFIMLLLKVVSSIAYVLCGFDYRFGWSRDYLAPVPWWLTVLALAGYLVCYLQFIPVLNANRFAASIIQIETGQTVAASGPYRLVRHPMYSVSLGIWLCLPLALGSFVVLPIAVLMIPILIFRLLNEEKFLQRELPGYSEYCQRTRYRLIPFVW